MQVLAEYTFEEASDTPYILLPYMFEPGREALFKLTIISDDRDVWRARADPTPLTLGCCRPRLLC